MIYNFKKMSTFELEVAEKSIENVIKCSGTVHYTIYDLMRQIREVVKNRKLNLSHFIDHEEVKA